MATIYKSFSRYAKTNRTIYKLGTYTGSGSFTLPSGYSIIEVAGGGAGWQRFATGIQGGASGGFIRCVIYLSSTTTCTYSTGSGGISTPKSATVLYTVTATGGGTTTVSIGNAYYFSIGGGLVNSCTNAATLYPIDAGSVSYTLYNKHKLIYLNRASGIRGQINTVTSKKYTTTYGGKGQMWGYESYSGYGAGGYVYSSDGPNGSSFADYNGSSGAVQAWVTTPTGSTSRSIPNYWFDGLYGYNEHYIYGAYRSSKSD